MAEKPWTADEVAELKRLFKTGLSASHVGAELGRSRNSVIGKSHRLGIVTTRPKPPGTSRRNLRRRGHQTKSRKLGADGNLAKRLIYRRELQITELVNVPVQPPSPVVPVAPLNIALPDLEPYHCRYVVDDGVPALFCGHQKQGGSSYCAAHHAICWRPIPTRKRDPRPREGIAA